MKTSEAASPSAERVFLMALHGGGSVQTEDSTSLTRCPSCGCLTTIASSYCGSCGDPLTAGEDSFAQDHWYSWA